MKDKSVRICPKCGSLEVKSVYTASPFEKAGKVTNARINAIAFVKNIEEYICKECDYAGICPLIEESNVNKFKKHLKTKK